jgi:hypothetical protein
LFGGPGEDRTPDPRVANPAQEVCRIDFAARLATENFAKTPSELDVVIRDRDGVQPVTAVSSRRCNPHTHLQASRASRTQGYVSNRVPRRVFLLSPANAAGVRGRLILKESARFDLALRFRRDGLPLGELFSFISGLNFRGKLAYARAFAPAPPGMPGAFVITPSRGLVPPRSDCIDCRTAGSSDGSHRTLGSPLPQSSRA